MCVTSENVALSPASVAVQLIVPPDPGLAALGRESWLRSCA